MRYLILLTGLILLIFFGLPEVVLYSKSGISRWLPPLIIFLGIPFLLYKTLADFNVSVNIAFIISISSVLLIGPLFGLWTERLANLDLERNGGIKAGIVSEKWFEMRPENYVGEWLYKATFKIDNKIYYTFSAKDVSNEIKTGDTVLIRYSKRNPENNIILDRSEIHD